LIISKKLDNNICTMTITEAIKWLREERGLNFKDLSELAQIGQNQPSRIESGDVSPTFDTIYRMLQGMKPSEEQLHKFAHLVFGLEFPLRPEPADPLISELLILLGSETRDFKRGLLFAMRLYVRGDDALAKPEAAQPGQG
jgi:transcriptional regulator with XRE-family HTH domain